MHLRQLPLVRVWVGIYEGGYFDTFGCQLRAISISQNGFWWSKTHGQTTKYWSYFAKFCSCYWHETVVKARIFFRNLPLLLIRAILADVNLAQTAVMRRLHFLFLQKCSKFSQCSEQINLLFRSWKRLPSFKFTKISIYRIAYLEWYLNDPF